MPLFYSLRDLKKDSEKILIQLDINKILHLVSIPGSQRFKELCGALGSAHIKLGALTGLL